MAQINFRADEEMLQNVHRRAAMETLQLGQRVSINTVLVRAVADYLRSPIEGENRERTTGLETQQED